jgi:hypothetical protein
MLTLNTATTGDSYDAPETNQSVLDSLSHPHNLAHSHTPSHSGYFEIIVQRQNFQIVHAATISMSLWPSNAHPPVRVVLLGCSKVEHFGCVGLRDSGDGMGWGYNWEYRRSTQSCQPLQDLMYGCIWTFLGSVQFLSWFDFERTSQLQTCNTYPPHKVLWSLDPD